MKSPFFTPDCDSLSTSAPSADAKRRAWTIYEIAGPDGWIYVGCSRRSARDRFIQHVAVAHGGGSRHPLYEAIRIHRAHSFSFRTFAIAPDRIVATAVEKRRIADLRAAGVQLYNTGDTFPGPSTTLGRPRVVLRVDPYGPEVDAILASHSTGADSFKSYGHACRGEQRAAPPTKPVRKPIVRKPLVNKPRLPRPRPVDPLDAQLDAIVAQRRAREVRP